MLAAREIRNLQKERDNARLNLKYPEDEFSKDIQRIIKLIDHIKVEAKNLGITLRHQAISVYINELEDLIEKLQREREELRYVEKDYFL